jgi:anti-anti-sigma factor
MPEPRSGQCRGNLPDDRHTGPREPFELTSKLDGDQLEIVLAGELDMAASFAFETAVDRELSGHGVRRLVFDLSAVPFIDSAGLGALLSLRQRARDHGIQMTLADVSPQVGRVLELSGTAPMLTD